MLHKTLLTLFLTILLCACGNDTASTTAENEVTATTEAEPSPETNTPAKERPSNSASAHFASDVRTIGPAMTPGQKDMLNQLSQLGQTATENKLLGYYTGDFGPNRITLILTELIGTKLGGYSVCAGNYRPLYGDILVQEGGTYEVKIAEPGGDPYDGTFTFNVSTADGKLQGKWEPFRKAGNTPRSYQLTAKDFTYRDDVGLWPEASQRLLTEEEVWNHTSDDLRLMRNEIYARHGYSFKIKDMRYHFEAQDWYMPITTDIRETLTDIEAENIALIYQYETYYEEYYDDFGR
ncbi:MAG: YARHG domain-containing protein [Bacteroidota bacterium]